MNSAKRLAWRDPIADGDVHVDAGRLVVRRACEFCQPCDPAIVYNLNKSSPFGQKRSVGQSARKRSFIAQTVKREVVQVSSLTADGTPNGTYDEGLRHDQVLQPC